MIHNKHALNQFEFEKNQNLDYFPFLITGKHFLKSTNHFLTCTILINFAFHFTILPSTQRIYHTIQTSFAICNGSYFFAPRIQLTQLIHKCILLLLVSIKYWTMYQHATICLPYICSSYLFQCKHLLCSSYSLSNSLQMPTHNQLQRWNEGHNSVCDFKLTLLRLHCSINFFYSTTSIISFRYFKSKMKSEI